MRRLGGAALVVVLALGLSACGGSARHVLDICGDVTSGTAALDRYEPAHPVTALQFALGRFDLVEEAVSKARETSLPSGAATTLRTDWLDPAVASMASWGTRLQALRSSVQSADHTGFDPAYAAALAIGTVGVDTGALRGAGYGACAAAFTAPSVASTGR